MIYSIFRNSILVASVKPDDNSELSQKKQSEDIIRLNFTLTTLVEFQIGDYISYTKTNQLYKLNKKPVVIESPDNYQYQCIFEGSIHELKKTKVFLTTNKVVGYYKDYKFSLTGNAQTFLAFIVDNLNRNSSGYSIGKYKTTEFVTIDFNNWNVLEAITKIAETLKFSWYLDGKILNFDDKAVETTYVLQVGRLLGFTELTRLRVESEDMQTVVYGYGSTENLPPRTAESGPVYDSGVLTENRLCFSGVDGESRLEKNVDLYGRIESVQEFDIKPERVGSITAIDSTDVRILYDTSIEFDIEQYKSAGLKPKICFLDGLLANLTFDISFDYLTKKITLDFYSDESGQYPNDNIKAAVSDTYRLFNIILPQNYIDVAIGNLLAATEAYLNEKSKALELFVGKLDDIFVQENSIILDLGDMVRVVSGVFKIDNLYEIKELVQSITIPSRYSIKFGDVLPKSLLSLLKNTNFAIQQSIYSIQKNTYTVNETDNTVNNQVTNILGQDLTWLNL